MLSIGCVNIDLVSVIRSGDYYMFEDLTCDESKTRDTAADDDDDEIPTRGATGGPGDTEPVRPGPLQVNIVILELDPYRLILSFRTRPLQVNIVFLELDLYGLIL